jgi:hypothetical protein
VTAYGHLTLQFTFLIATLWSATFLAGTRLPRARLLTSLAVAAGMTVWLPLNVLAIVLLARRRARARCGTACGRWTRWVRPSG